MKPLPNRLLILLYPLAKRFSSLLPIPVLSSWIMGLNLSVDTLVSYPDGVDLPSSLFTFQPSLFEDLSILVIVCWFDSSLVRHSSQQFRFR